MHIGKLTSFVLAVSSNREESKWVVQILESPTSKLLVSYGLMRLYDAIHLWQIDPVVQVITLEDSIIILITLLGCVKHSD